MEIQPNTSNLEKTESTDEDEFKRLEKTKAIKKIKSIVKKHKHVLVMQYIMYLFAGIILLTPIPDEFGVSMLAGFATIKPINFAIVSFLLHSAGIFLFFLMI